MLGGTAHCSRTAASIGAASASAAAEIRPTRCVYAAARSAGLAMGSGGRSGSDTAGRSVPWRAWYSASHQNGAPRVPGKAVGTNSVAGSPNRRRMGQAVSRKQQ